LDDVERHVLFDVLEEAQARTHHDGRLPTWGRWLRDTLPNGSFRTLEGEWHGVPPENLAPVLREFFTSGEKA
jgi:hypothetical protein